MEADEKAKLLLVNQYCLKHNEIGTVCTSCLLESITRDIIITSEEHYAITK